MAKEAAPQPEDPTPELVNQAQKLVGELMWLSTRTRPDVAFATSRCAQEILSHPTWVIDKPHKSGSTSKTRQMKAWNSVPRKVKDGMVARGLWRSTLTPALRQRLKPRPRMVL